MRISRSITAGALATLAIASAAVLGTAIPASAHNYLASSNPAAGAVVTEQPGTFVVTTNDAILDAGADSQTNAIQILGADGLYYGEGCVTVNGASLTLPAQLGQPGEYTVIWQVVSTDGHPIADQFTFTWQPDASQKLVPGHVTVPVCGETVPEPATPSMTPVPEETTDVPAASTPEATDDTATDGGQAALGDILWIAIAVGVVVVVAVIAFVMIRRSQKREAVGSAAAAGSAVAGNESGSSAGESRDDGRDDSAGGGTSDSDWPGDSGPSGDSGSSGGSDGGGSGSE